MHTFNPIRTAFMVSGSGSTMETALQAIRGKEHPLQGIDPVLIVASKPGIPAIGKALALGVPQEDVIVLPKAELGKLVDELRARRVALAMQLGWLPLTPADVIEYLQGNFYNQHPGGLDFATSREYDFGGKKMHGIKTYAAQLYFARETGRKWATVVTHRVGVELDSGAVVGERRVPVFSNDTPETLQARGLPVERKLQVDLLRRIGAGETLTPVEHEPHWLVKPAERDLLARCKQKAIDAYPDNG